MMRGQKRRVVFFWVFFAALVAGAFPLARAGAELSGISAPQADQEKREKFLSLLREAAAVYHAGDDSGRAASLLRLALVAEPHSPEVYYALSQVETDPKVVIRYALEAITYRPFLDPSLAWIDTFLFSITDARLYETLGRAYQQTGDHDKAREYLGRAIRDNTNTRRVAASYEHLAKVLAGEDSDKASALMRQSVKAYKIVGDEEALGRAREVFWQERRAAAMRFWAAWNDPFHTGGGTGVLFLKMLSFVLFCAFLYAIADRERFSPEWMAWVPFLQWFLVCDMAGLPRVLAALSLVVFLPLAGPFMLLGVKFFFLLVVLVMRRAPLWSTPFAAFGLPFIELLPWALMAFQHSERGKK